MTSNDSSLLGSEFVDNCLYSDKSYKCSLLWFLKFNLISIPILIPEYFDIISGMNRNAAFA